MKNPYADGNNSGMRVKVELSNGQCRLGTFTEATDTAPEGWWTLLITEEEDWLDINPAHIVSVESESKVIG